VPLQRFAESIEATGHEQVILSTDFGQTHSDRSPDGSVHFATELARWLPEDAIVQMMTANPRRALGLA
jgi:hypothetical protein